MKPKADAIRAYEDVLRTDPGNVPYRGYAEERLQELLVSPAWNPLLRCIDPKSAFRRNDSRHICIKTS